MTDALPMFWVAWIMTACVTLAVVACGEAELGKRAEPVVCPVPPTLCPDKETRP